MKKEEVQKRLFMSYGSMITIDDDLDEYNLDDCYTFSKRNPATNEVRSTVVIRLCDALFRNIYWIEPSMEDVNFKINNNIFVDNTEKCFKILLEGTYFTFKPKYISIDGKELLHCFDKSYFISGNPNQPRKVLQKIISIFEKEDIILNYLDFLD